MPKNKKKNNKKTVSLEDNLHEVSDPIFLGK